MKLRDLMRDVPVRKTRGDVDVEITCVTADSRLAVPGALFVAVPGFKTDGAKFIDAALGKGAVAVVSERDVALLSGGAACVGVVDARSSLALIAANFYGRPAGQLSIIGVTGTSGKTTTTKMIESIYDAAGEPAGLIGTIEYRAGDERLTADRTTPDAVVLQQWFAKMVDAGVHHAVMEVSSHALALKRTFGIHFAAAVFTNLSQDHFDFHGDFESYFSAKKILFDQIDRSRKSAIVNIDDIYGRRLANELGDAVVTFGRGADADIRPGDHFEISVGGLHGSLITPGGEVRVDSKLLGAPNLYNWLGAVGAALSVGMDIPAIEEGIRSLTAVRGRFEYVESSGGPTVIVDYAHKPDALEKLLLAVRDLASGRRVVLVFGCGGDRDKDKRAMMGAIAARLADQTILTSDNPRGEAPEAIIDDIEKGMRGATGYSRITERRRAISRSIAEARNDDVVVIAGKGHESYQVIGDQVSHFDDREEAERALRTRHENRTSKSASN
ncbi:MAG TPA: UDP-N-acetylmuramoyl-L-alanyl-D-glutamate--2,6-diaminopimelate ligase [Thermoanaerobaculia bacterium]|nr:UDP-N-acetylmuramoyl-L-alanyl-D-glutamate--2,6-diaminopimelate ligase [Thermoanaerobaculia bacterium]